MIILISTNSQFILKVIVLTGARGYFSNFLSVNQAKFEQMRLSVPKKFTSYSEDFGEQRTILVYLPEDDSRAGQKCPVLNVPEGEYDFQQAVTKVRFNFEFGYVRGDHPVHRMIVAGIVNRCRLRSLEASADRDDRG